MQNEFEANVAKENLKILIIKLGYSETLDREISRSVSLGDVLRCTVILSVLKELHPNSHITWLASSESAPLVLHNPLIDMVYMWDEFMPFVLMEEKFDIVINLEKVHGICALTNMINAWEKIGFRFDSQRGSFDTYMRSHSAKKYIFDKTENNKRDIWQKVLVEMIGGEWRTQEYSLGYQPTSKVQFDVGFNYLVGNKWPTKALDEKKWKELEKTLTDMGVSVSWQKGTTDLYEYMEWINSCKVIVSNDSLGLHLALALKKYVVGIFGPTDPSEIYFYNRGEAIVPNINYDCIPCYNPNCHKDTVCMDYVESGNILKAIKIGLGCEAK